MANVVVAKMIAESRERSKRELNNQAFGDFRFKVDPVEVERKARERRLAIWKNQKNWRSPEEWELLKDKALAADDGARYFALTKAERAQPPIPEDLLKDTRGITKTETLSESQMPVNRAEPRAKAAQMLRQTDVPASERARMQAEAKKNALRDARPKIGQPGYLGRYPEEVPTRIADGYIAVGAAGVSQPSGRAQAKARVLGTKR